MEICSKTEDSVAINIDQDTEDPPPPHSAPAKTDFPNAEPYLSKFARQLSSDSRDNSEINISGYQVQGARRYFNVYPVESCTKSAIALTQPSQSGHSSGMRRNSNSTMSTIQLPLVSSTAQLVAHVRRHSNADNTTLGFLPTGSVELGAYMMEKGNSEMAGGKGVSADSRAAGVRRIKSAALEIGCPPPSVSNLSPHPNSVETIGGQVLKNPKSAIIPPPSKSLIRNPHLNLWPKNSSNSIDGNSLPYMNYGSEIVYPIAEISDEMQTSQCQESDLESLSSQCDTDYEDDNGVSIKHQLRGFDSDFNRPAEMNSSDTEYENNGSRSPLLDRNDCLNDVKIVKTKSDKSELEHKKQSNSSAKGLLKNNSFSVDTKHSDKLKCDRNNRLLKNNSFNATSSAVTEEEGSAPRSVCDDVNNKQYDCRIVDSSEKSPAKICKQKSNKSKTFDPGDYFDKSSASSKDFLLEKSSVDSNECLLENFERHKQKLELEVEEVKKPPDRETSNSSGSLEMQDARQEIATETSDISDHKTLSDAQSKDISPVVKEESELKLQCDENSLYGITWLFDESNHCQEDAQHSLEKSSKPSCSSADSNTSSQRNLGAIPKQIKNLTRTRTSSLKENKKKEKHKEKEREPEPTQEEIDTVEAHSALVQGLECLFAATNANTVVMPPLNREERPRSHRQQVDQHRRDSQKQRKRSIEEMAQTSTNTILPTSMPLLAAFLNSRVDYPHVPIYLPGETDPCSSENQRNPPTDGTYYELQRTRPLMDRNHRNRMRKIKRSTRQRNNPVAGDKAKEENKSEPANLASTSSSNVHFATSFEDTTDGAIHCFVDEYGNWMSYTFDKNSSGHAKEAAAKASQAKAQEAAENPADTSLLEGSCISITSDITGDLDMSTKLKQGDSIDQGAANESIYNSSSNQGSNNPLLSSNNNSTSMLPVSQSANSNRNKTIYVMEPAVQPSQRRSPVAILTESLLERVELQRMLSPNMQLNFLLNSSIPSDNNTTNVLHLSMPTSNSIGDNSMDMDVGKKRFRLIDSIENSYANQRTAYYKFKIFSCWKLKVTMDRLKLMALFDRNLTLKEAILSIFLGIMVSILGAFILHTGFYKDIYAFWFCFVIAGSQYSLFKSVQPDAASPVHGFNRMVAFSRPVYFCLCASILCLVHYTLEQYDLPNESHNEKLTLYGFQVKTKEVLQLTEEVISKLLLFFPLAFSLGLFPQVNTFAMYLFEQIDMHVFGGNATASLSASIYCVFRSLLAIGVMYGFAFGGLTEAKGSQHILFSIFCGLFIPISYHLSRCASDYTMVWNLIKNHLIPADLYNVHSVENSHADARSSNADTEKQIPVDAQSAPKNRSESNISKQQSMDSSASKINFSSETNISKTQKRSQTSVNSSVNSLKVDSNLGATVNSSGSIKTEHIGDETKDAKLKSLAEEDPAGEGEMEDPLPRKLQETVNSRFKNDVIICGFMALFILGIHSTTVFSTLQPELNPVSFVL